RAPPLRSCCRTGGRRSALGGTALSSRLHQSLGGARPAAGSDSRIRNRPHAAAAARGLLQPSAAAQGKSGAIAERHNRTSTGLQPHPSAFRRFAGGLTRIPPTACASLPWTLNRTIRL